MPASYILPRASIENPDMGYIQSNGIALEHYSNYDVYVIGDVANTDIVYGCQINGGVDYLSRSANQAFWARHSSAYKYNLSSSTLVDGVPVYYYLSGNRPADSADFTQNFSSIQEAAEYIYNLGLLYPITYHYTNSTVSGPAEAAIGDTVTVSAVPNVDYGITDPTTQISVTNNDAPVNFTWDAATNTIMFTMPDPT